MPSLLPISDNPFSPESDVIHAGKVFVLTPAVLRAVGAKGSDGSDPSELVNRFLLCLWDIDDGRSLWITLQSVGDFVVPYESKRLYAGEDPNWMDEAKITYHRNGTVWCMGRPGNPVRYRQAQQRVVVKDELERIQKRISEASVEVFLR